MIPESMYQDKKISMIKQFDKQKAINSFNAVLSVNKLDDELKTLLANNQLDMPTLNQYRDINPVEMEQLYDKYKKNVESVQSVFGTGNPTVAYDLLAEFTNLWGTQEKSKLTEKSDGFWNKKFDDNLRLRAKVLDERAKGNIDDAMMKRFNTLFEATTLENKKFLKKYSAYFEALKQTETFVKRMNLQAYKFEEAYGDEIPAQEELSKELTYSLFSEFLRLSPGGENKLDPVTSIEGVEKLRENLSKVFRAYSAETARKRYQITSDADGNEYVTTPDGSSYKAIDYSYGVPMIEMPD